MKRKGLVEFFYDVHEADKFVTTHLFGAIRDIQKDLELSEDEVTYLENSLLDLSTLG
jgi:hypothetical protein